MNTVSTRMFQFVMVMCIVTTACRSAIASERAEVVTVALALGVTPDSLAVTDLAGQFSRFTSRLEEGDGLRNDYVTAMEEVQATRQQIATLRAACRVNPENQNLQSELTAARQQLESGREALRSMRNALCDYMLEGLSDNTRSQLSAMRDGAHQNVPPAYCIVQRTEVEWASLKAALRAEKRAVRRGTDLAPEYAAILNDTRSDSRFILAEQRHDRNLAQAKQAFADYLAEP